MGSQVKWINRFSNHEPDIEPNTMVVSGEIVSRSLYGWADHQIRAYAVSLEWFWHHKMDSG